MFKPVLIGKITYDTVGRIHEAAVDIRLNGTNPESDSIVLQIDSGGGQLTPMFSIVETMQKAPMRFITFVRKECKSAAVGIVASGYKGRRIALRSASFMTHASGVHFEAMDCTLEEFERETTRFIHRMKEDRRKYVDILVRQSGRPKSFWQPKLVEEFTNFTADEAKEWGLIDHIVENTEEAYEMICSRAV